MSVQYAAVTWTRQKRIYDTVLALGVLLVVGGFAGATFAFHPDATIETALIRGLGIAGFLLLTLILSIGPLARLDRRFLPFLYNRRHLGVTLGLLAVAHAVIALVQFHALGNVNPLVSLFTSNTDWSSPAAVPFELFGVVALAILFLMAATSHDYWLSILTPPIWKKLHMLVYLAYVALVAHVGFGAIQDQTSPVLAAVVGASALLVGGLHLAAALEGRPADQPGSGPGSASSAPWIDLGPADTIAEGRARIGLVAGERVAVFRHQNRLSCVSNVCKHQNGPLGEGRIIDGCITCPWHGYQYRPDSGSSPPPFNDTIPTFNLRVVGGRVEVDPVPNPAGTRVEPVAIAGSSAADATEFYVGYQLAAPPGIARFTGRAVATILVAVAGLAVGLARVQSDFAPARFDYGRPTTIEGIVRAEPYPTLEVSGPGAETKRYLLAAAGKHGAQIVTAPLDGRRVRITGPLAYRGATSLLEIATTTALDSSQSTADAPTDLGTYRLVGEIVDSKCYLGVMNPGQGKTHRACAARCLSGGLTPLLKIRGADGTEMVLLVLDGTGAPLPDLAGWAGRPVKVLGRVQRLNDLWVVRIQGTVEPAS